MRLKTVSSSSRMSTVTAPASDAVGQTPGGRPQGRPQPLSVNSSTQKMVKAAIPMVAKPAAMSPARCVTRDTR